MQRVSTPQATAPAGWVVLALIPCFGLFAAWVLTSLPRPVGAVLPASGARRAAPPAAPTTCCTGLTICSVAVDCRVDAETSTNQFDLSAEVTRSCTGTVDVTTTPYLEVSPDLTQWTQLAAGVATSVTLTQPTTTIFASIYDVLVPAEYSYYRMRLHLVEAGTCLVADYLSETNYVCTPTFADRPAATAGVTNCASTCCGDLIATVDVQCISDSITRRDDIYYSIPVTNPCTVTDTARLTLYVEYTDPTGLWTVLTTTNPSTITLAPAATTTFTGTFEQLLFPYDQFYRVHARLEETSGCQIADFYSCADYICTPTLHPTRPLLDTCDPAAGPSSRELWGGGNPSELTWCPTCGQWVTTATGNFWDTTADLAVPGRGPGLGFARTYNAQAVSLTRTVPLGPGWTHNYNLYLERDPNGLNYYVHQENGSIVPFSGAGPHFLHPDRVLADLTANGDGTYTFTRTHGQEHFTFAPITDTVTTTLKLTAIRDRNNYPTTLTYTSTGALAGQLWTAADAAGRTLTFTYTTTAGSPLLTGVADPAGRTISFRYDITGNLTVATDVLGLPTGYAYDSAHHLQTVTDPRQGMLQTSYSNGRAVQQTDPLDQVMGYRYSDCTNSGCGQAVITDTRGFTTTQTYDQNRLTQVERRLDDQHVATWQYAYSATLPSALYTITDPNGHPITYTWDTQSNLRSVTDALAQTSVYTYSARNDLLWARNPLQLPITYTRDVTGNLLSVSRPLTTGIALTTTFGYDPQQPGDVLTVTNPLGKQWRYAYNSAGDVISTTNPVTATTIYTPDRIGRLTAVRLPEDVTATTVLRDAWGAPTRITDTLGYTRVYTYDNNGNLIHTRDPNGQVLTYTYNLDNELTRVTRPDGTHSDYEYDLGGQVVTQTNGLGQPTRYAYDAAGRVISSTDALTRTTVYTYDLASNLIARRDPLQRETTYSYDPVDQLTGITYNSLTTPDVSYRYDALGRRTVMTDGIGTTLYDYDWLDRLTQVTQGNGRTVRYGYDHASRLTALYYPNLSGSGVLTVTRGYDAADRLTGVTDWLTNLTQFGYDAKNNLTSISYPNGAQARLGYDAANQLITTTHAITATPFLSLTYTLDPAGLLAGAGEQRGTAARDQHAYEYDPLNRLTGDGISVQQTVSRTWGYDGATEITQTTHSLNGGAPTIGVRTYDAANELKRLVESSGGSTTADWGFSYDADGNRTAQEDKVSGAKYAYTYDQADRLIAYGLQSYSYSGDGLRMQKSGLLLPTNFTWDVNAGLPLLLQDNDTSYLYGPGGLLIEQVPAGGTPSYAHADQLGSIRALTDGSGAVVRTADYAAYGQPVSTTGSTSTPFGYAGAYTDAESGLLYLRARYYDPATQQFLTVDPLLAATEQAYTYAGGSPLNAGDPSGLDKSIEDDGGGGGGPAGDGPYGGSTGAAGGRMPGAPDIVREQLAREAQFRGETFRAEERSGGGGGVTSRDLYVTGNSSQPRPPRVQGVNRLPGEKVDVSVDAEGNVIPGTGGASSFEQISQLRTNGHVWRLPAGSNTECFNVIRDGRPFGPMSPGHNTFEPAQLTPAEEFVRSFLNLDWEPVIGPNGLQLKLP